MAAHCIYQDAGAFFIEGRPSIAGVLKFLEICSKLARSFLSGGS